MDRNTNGKNPTPLDAAQTFLRRLYGGDATGYLGIVDNDIRTTWFAVTDLEAAAQHAASLEGNVWFNVGLQTEKPKFGRGRGSAVRVVPGAFGDIDIADGVAHTETNLPPDLKSAMGLLDAVPVKPSVIVHSGHGIQPYWLFNEPAAITRDEDRARLLSIVRRVQAMYRNEARKRGWKIENTSDLARMLRVPGTTNRKSEPVPVTIIHNDPDARYALEEIEAVLPSEEELGWTQAAKPTNGKYPPARYPKIVEGCGWMRRCRDDAAELPEPEWYAQLGIVGRCENGDLLAHALSQPHPKYSREETDAKLKHALEAAGPVTCRYVHDYLSGEDFCDRCQHRDKIKSPINLGTSLGANRDDENEQWQVLTLSNVTPKPVNWCWQYYLPRGAVTLIDGDPGLGKSSLAIDVAARVSTGSIMPDGTGAAGMDEPGDVVILSAEDGIESTLTPRFIAAGADMTRIHTIAVDQVAAVIELPEDLEAIEDVIESTNAKILIVDPVVAYISGTINSNQDAAIRRVLSRLARLAERHNIAIIGIRHLNKNTAVKAMYRGGGSIGFVAAARAVMIVGEHPDDPDLVVVVLMKSNLGPKRPALSYHIETLMLNGTNVETSRIVWEDETDDLTAEDLLDTKREDKAPVLHHAMEFLKDLLQDGPMLKDDVEEAAKHTEVSLATLRRAREELGITAGRIVGKGLKYWWRLPEAFESPVDENGEVTLVPAEDGEYASDDFDDGSRDA